MPDTMQAAGPLPPAPAGAVDELNFTVGDTAALQRAAKDLAAIVPRSTGIELLGMIKVEAGDDRVTLSAHDFGLSARIEVEAEVEAPGAVCVEPTRFLAALDGEAASVCVKGALAETERELAAANEECADLIAKLGSAEQERDDALGDVDALRERLGEAAA